MKKPARKVQKKLTHAAVKKLSRTEETPVMEKGELLNQINHLIPGRVFSECPRPYGVGVAMGQGTLNKEYQEHLNKPVKMQGAPSLPGAPTSYLPARSNAVDAAQLAKNIGEAKEVLTQSRAALASTDPRDPNIGALAEVLAANYDHLANMIERLIDLTP